MWRHAPAARELTRLVGEGALGPVRVVRAQFSFQLEASRGAGDTRFRADLDGGALMDLGCYCISAIRLILGEPQSLHGRQVVGPSGVDVVFSAVLGYDGAVGHFDCGFVLPHRRELEIVGEEATLVVRGEWPGGMPSLTLGDAPIELEAANPYRCELDNVSAAIRGEGELLLGREDAVAQARAIEALYASAA
jgi:predicted dehydrogenase